jgi:hypothetical protein
METFYTKIVSIVLYFNTFAQVKWKKKNQAY